MHYQSRTTYIFEALTELLSELEIDLREAIGDDELSELKMKARRIQDHLRMLLTLTSYFEVRNFLGELRELIKETKDKVNWKAKAIVPIAYRRVIDLHLDAIALISMIKTSIISDMIHVLDLETVCVVKNYFIKELSKAKRLLNASAVGREIRELLKKLIDDVKNEIRKTVQEAEKQILKGLSKLKIIEEKLELVPKEFREIIESKLLPIISILYTHDEKYEISNCGETEFLQPLSFETILVNASRVYGGSVEELHKHLDFVVRLLRPDLSIDYCVHAVYADDRTFYPKYKCKYYDLSERIIIIESQPLREYLKNLYIEKLEDVDITDTIEKIDKRKSSPINSITLLSLHHILHRRRAPIVDQETLIAETEKVLKGILGEEFDLETVNYLLKEFIEELEEIQVKELEKNFSEKQLLWAKVLKHDYTGHSCNPNETLIVTDQLKIVLHALLESIYGELIEGAQQIINPLKEIEDKIQRVIVIESILIKGEYADPEKCKKSLDDLIERKQVIIVNNRCISTPALDEETRKNLEEEKSQLQKQIKEKIKQLIS